MKINRTAVAQAARSAILRMKGASRKKKLVFIAGTVAAACVGVDPELASGLIDYFMNT